MNHYLRAENGSMFLTLQQNYELQIEWIPEGRPGHFSLKSVRGLRAQNGTVPQQKKFIIYEC